MMKQNLGIFVLIILFLVTEKSCISQTDTIPRNKVGLVLSGGGAKGIAHIGVLKVLEEEGVPIDYISGTSMGSIIGALYSIGYTAKDIESLAINQNWGYLLTDEVMLKDLSIDEKEQVRKYFISFPFERFKIKLPDGLNNGHNISARLAELTWGYHLVKDFTKLPIPFSCIATNIVTGESVTLNKGYLPEALRASMAIPTIFTPVEIDGELLVDGGLANNFPVQEVKNMGADIVIGIDCGLRSYPKEKINTLATVIEQSIYILALEESEMKKDLCTIYIKPDFSMVTSTSFFDAKILIDMGEKYAREHIKEIRKLKAQIGTRERIKINRNNIQSSIYIEKIEVKGLKNVSAKLVKGELNFNTPSKISEDEIKAAVDRLYGSQFFETIKYRIQDTLNTTILVMTIEEKSNNVLRIGANYNSDYDASLTLNTTFKNAIINGSKFLTDLRIGKNYALMANYLIPTAYRSNNKKWTIGWVPDVQLFIDLRKYSTYAYQNNTKIAEYNYKYYATGLNLKSNISNNFEFGIGTRYEYSVIKPEINSLDENNIYYTTLNLNALFKLDTYDKPYYPKKGHRLTTKLEYVNDISDNSIKFSNVSRFSMRFIKAFSITDKLIIIGNLFGGVAIGDSIPLDYNFYMGGLLHADYNIGVFPFTGMELYERFNKNATIIGIDIQYQFIGQNYFILTGNIGKMEESLKNIINENSICFGYGIKYGNRSIIGPVELAVMKNNLRNNIQIFVNIGFWF